jgi:hypothetical protein
LFGVVPRGPRVPKPERREPVGVNVFGRALEFGEGRDGHAAHCRVWVVHLEEQGLVGLDDQGPAVILTPVQRR